MAIVLVAIGCGIAPGCGKKGAPLPPIVHIPEAPPKIAAQRLGDDVYVTVTVPSHNIDQTMPADVNRVEVYGGTTNSSVPTPRLLEVTRRVGVVPVLPPADPDAKVTPARAIPAGAVPVGATQGAPITILDRLTDADLVPRTPPVAPSRRGSRAAVTPATPPAPGPLQRSYVAVGFSKSGRPGPPARVDLPLTPLPSPPSQIEVHSADSAVTIEWSPSGGVIGFLTDRALPIERDPGASPLSDSAEPKTDSSLPPGPTSYLIYRTLSPDPLALPTVPGPSSAWHAQPPEPLNAMPTPMLEFTDAIEAGREQCYVVRAVRGTGTGAVIGRPSSRGCVRVIDTTPPAAPTGLAAVATAGAISLIWEPNVEDDFGGYIVLRGDAGGATLQALTPTPIAAAQFTDRTVMPGARYVYAVVAVDTRVPLPNVSGESNRVEETAR